MLPKRNIAQQVALLSLICNTYLHGGKEIAHKWKICKSKMTA